MCIEAQNTKEVITETTKTKRRRALVARDESMASMFAQEVGIKHNTLLRKLELSRNLNHVGVHALVQIRTSTFMYTNNYIYSRKICLEWLNRCIFCGDEEKDDA